jgi:hypothetical protein
MDQEKSMLEIPINLGDPAAPASILKAPVMAAISAYGTLVDECTVEVETAEEIEGGHLRDRKAPERSEPKD